MEKCHIRIDYDPQEHPEHFIPTGGQEDGRPQLLARMFIFEGYSVTLTHNRHRRNSPNGGDSVVVAPQEFAAGILQLLVERGDFTEFYFNCGMRSTFVSGVQAVIRLSGSKSNHIRVI